MASVPPVAHFTQTPSPNPTNRTLLLTRPTLLTSFPPSPLKPQRIPISKRKKQNPTVCVAPEDGKLIGGTQLEAGIAPAEKKRSERFAYFVAAVMSSLCITSTAAVAVYYRFSWQTEGGGAVPYAEIVGTFGLAIGSAVGMEYWARWAHRSLWHASLWHMHESHHKPRQGAFEMNDVFAIINAVPAIALISFGFYNRGFIPGLCFGAGLGITVFGMAYMFVHDGLVHRRFPVGPVADVPYFRRVAAAHQVHHSDKFGGIPYGLFLGPKELEEVGGGDELDKEIDRRTKLSKRTS